MITPNPAMLAGTNPRPNPIHIQLERSLRGRRVDPRGFLARAEALRERLRLSPLTHAELGAARGRGTPKSLTEGVSMRSHGAESARRRVALALLAGPFLLACAHSGREERGEAGRTGQVEKLCPAAESAGSIVGRIQDEQTGAPLRRAMVWIPGTSCGDISDDEGRFSIAGGPPGKYEIEVSFIGYEDAIVKGVRVRPARETVVAAIIMRTLSVMVEY